MVLCYYGQTVDEVVNGTIYVVVSYVQLRNDDLMEVTVGIWLSWGAVPAT